MAANSVEHYQVSDGSGLRAEVAGRQVFLEEHGAESTVLSWSVNEEVITPYQFLKMAAPSFKDKVRILRGDKIKSSRLLRGEALGLYTLARGDVQLIRVEYEDEEAAAVWMRAEEDVPTHIEVITVDWEHAGRKAADFAAPDIRNSLPGLVSQLQPEIS